MESKLEDPYKFEWVTLFIQELTTLSDKIQLNNYVYLDNNIFNIM